MMEKLRALWATAKTTLHYGPSTEPLWTHVVDLLHNFEARIVSLETGLKDRISALFSEAEQALFGNIDKAMEAEFKSLVAGFEEKIAALEARIAALEGHLAVSIPPLGPMLYNTSPIPATAQPAASPELEPAKPSEQVIQPDKTVTHDELTNLLGGDQFENKQPAATSATDSSGTGDPAASPSVNPSLEQAAGLTLDQGEHHGE